jgi:hypothetical protein
LKVQVLRGSPNIQENKLFFGVIVLYCNITATRIDHLAYHFGRLYFKLSRIFQADSTKLDTVTFDVVIGNVEG